MINAIIIDDEDHCIERLSRLLSTHCADDLRLLASYKTVDEGVEAIHTLKPNLIFLDIQIHEKTGFDLLKKIDLTNVRIIFTTAYEQHAVSAFKFSAIDYLLKPIDKDELVNSVKKALNQMSLEETAERYETLFHNLRPHSGVSKKISLPTATGFDFVSLDEVIRCQANGNYTEFFLKDGQKLTVSRTLKDFETMFSEHHFFRVHYSHLVNLAYIKKYSKGKGGYIILTDNTEIEVSTRRRDAFLSKISEL
jgi:two-component system, LytTR family, response regulator